MKKYTGKNIDEILDGIVEEQNVDRDEIKYTVLEEKPGFLGVGKEIVIEAYTKKDIKDFIYDYLEKYFDNIDMEVELEIYEADDNFYKINLNAPNNAVLIGRGGQTLQAINTVLKAAVSGNFKTRISILVDINGYKEQRYEKVTRIANRVARTVTETHVDALLDPMPNDERKAIHNYLTDREHIATESEGEGNQRRIKIKYVD